MAAAAILKNRKIVISPLRFNQFCRAGSVGTAPMYGTSLLRSPSFPCVVLQDGGKARRRAASGAGLWTTRPPEEKSRPTLSATEGRSLQGTLTSQFSQRLPTSGSIGSRSPEFHDETGSWVVELGNWVTFPGMVFSIPGFLD